MAQRFGLIGAAWRGEYYLRIARSLPERFPLAGVVVRNREWRDRLHLDYGDCLGIYDFTGDQYFSWIRSPRLLVRGEEGEINGGHIRLLKDFQTPVDFALMRQETGHEGNLEGHYQRAILGDGEILYQNPFAPTRWSDDEIAVATSLARMQLYTETGECFYGVREACHDRYLDILISEAAECGKTLAATHQPWT